MQIVLHPCALHLLCRVHISRHSLEESMLISNSHLCLFLFLWKKDKSYKNDCNNPLHPQLLVLRSVALFAFLECSTIRMLLVIIILEIISHIVIKYICVCMYVSVSETEVYKWVFVVHINSYRTNLHTSKDLLRNRRRICWHFSAT